MRFFFTAVLAFFLVGSIIAIPVPARGRLGSGSKSPSPPPKGDTVAQPGTLSTGEQGVKVFEGDNIPNTAKHIADAKANNPNLDQPTELQAGNNRPEVMKQHDGGSPVGDGPFTKDEFPTNKEKIPGMPKDQQIAETSVQKLPSKEQGGVPNDTADKSKGRTQQGTLMADAKNIAQKISPGTDGVGVGVEHFDNTSGSGPQAAADGPAANTRSKKPGVKRGLDSQLPVVLVN